MAYSFTVMGRPHGKERPRFAKGHVYQPGTDKRSWRTQVALAARQAQVPMMEGPVWVQVDIARKLPDATLRSKRKIEELTGTWAIATPDTVNVLAEVMDALQGIAYKNDSAVVHCECYRNWADEDETTIQVGRSE